MKKMKTNPMAEIGRIGGKAGTGPAKKRAKSHYAKLARMKKEAALARKQREEGAAE